jgi:hypothetical protein
MTQPPTVAVRGEVHREVEPEIATVSATVNARAGDQDKAKRLLTERLDAVRALLDRYADAIDKRETAGVSIRPDYSGRFGERVRGYLGSATTTVTVHDFAVLGDLLLALGGLELTTVYGPYWALRPDSPAYREARHAALRDAVHRARDYAEALGSRIDALVEVADAGMSGQAPPQPMMFAAARSAPEGGDGGPELNLDPERQHVYASVEARFAITVPEDLTTL